MKLFISLHAIERLSERCDLPFATAFGRLASAVLDAQYMPDLYTADSLGRKESPGHPVYYLPALDAFAIVKRVEDGPYDHIPQQFTHVVATVFLNRVEREVA
jgi:hypothetical protein